MPPEQTQMNGDQSAAALAFATSLQEQLMPNVEMPEGGEIPLENAPVEPQDAPEQEEMGNRLDDLETKILDELATLRKEIKKTPKDDEDEIETLKKEIEAVLNEEEND